MKLDNRFGRYLVLASVSFVFFMFGSRFSTLRFGQVFPEQTAADREQLFSLENRIKELEGRSHDLDAANARITDLEAANTRLTQEIEAVKNVKPVIVYQPAAVSAVHHRNVAKVPAVEAVSQPSSEDDTVRRGDSPEKVRRVFGRPSSVHDFGDQEAWYYDDVGLKAVTFKDRVVSTWQLMPVEP